MENEKDKRTIIFIEKTLNIFILILFAIAIIFIISLTIQKLLIKEKIPNIFGYKVLQVLSGSMSGEFETGDTILIKEIKRESNLKIGDVVTYKVAENTLVTHRIINITKLGETLEYTTKGDANNTEDSEKIHYSDIEGIYVRKLNLIGKLINFMQKPYGIIIIFTMPIILIINIVNTEKRREEKRSKRKEKRHNYEIQKIKKLGDDQNDKK